MKAAAHASPADTRSPRRAARPRPAPRPCLPGYREQPGPLSAFQLGDALVFADTATLLLLDAQGQAAGQAGAGSGPGGQHPDLALHRAEIDQATGMLTEQLGVGIAPAFARLRAHAYAHDQRLA